MNVEISYLRCQAYTGIKARNLKVILIPSTLFFPTLNLSSNLLSLPCKFSSDVQADIITHLITTTKLLIVLQAPDSSFFQLTPLLPLDVSPRTNTMMLFLNLVTIAVIIGMWNLAILSHMTHPQWVHLVSLCRSLSWCSTCLKCPISGILKPDNNNLSIRSYLGCHLLGKRHIIHHGPFLCIITALWCLAMVPLSIKIYSRYCYCFSTVLFYC